MTIQLIYDVSFVAHLAAQSSSVTGVGRVIEHVLTEFLQDDALEVNVVGCYAGDLDPILTSLSAQAWTKNFSVGTVASLPAFRGRIGIANWLAPHQRQLERRIGEIALPGESMKRRLARTAMNMLRFVVDQDAIYEIATKEPCIFFASYWPPPDWLPSRLPRIVMVYDIYPLRYPNLCAPELHEMARRTLDTLDAQRDMVVSISEYTKADLCDLTGFPHDRVIVAPLAAEAKFQPIDDPLRIRQMKTKYGIGEGPYLLCVANPQPRKNIEVCVEAFHQLAQNVFANDLQLVLAGNALIGWGFDRVRERIASCPEISHRIRCVGHIDEADLPVLYSEAFAFLFPSTFEGFGLPVLEAMQCGTPVICSNATSLPEVVGNAGILIDPNSPEQFANAILTLIDDPNIRTQLGIAGRARALEFSWGRTAAQVNKAILALVNERF